MKRIFSDVIDAYDRLGDFYSSDDIGLEIAYKEYVNKLLTFQEFFQRISNKKALEAYGAENTVPAAAAASTAPTQSIDVLLL